jgi:hypothetical protein
MSRKSESVTVRLLFADGGEFHRESVVIARSSLQEHERLIDALQEDPAVMRSIYVDVDRLCSAWIVDDEA